MDVISRQPETEPGPAERFTGMGWMDRIAVPGAPSRLSALRVHFAPGARTAWHQHPCGQVLHVVEGVGRVQARGGPVHEVSAGDIVVSQPGEWHWHGASPRHFMTHLAIQDAGDDGADVHWGDHVSDDEYVRGQGSVSDNA